MVELSPTGRRFGARLRALIEGLGAAETGRPITVDALYKLIENEPDLAMSRGHLYRLVEGKAIPRLDLIEALARFFKVPVSYFLDDHTYLEETMKKVEIALADVDTLMNHLTELRVALVRERDSVIEKEKPKANSA